jgi:hypothetical protein
VVEATNLLSHLGLISEQNTTGNATSLNTTALNATGGTNDDSSEILEVFETIPGKFGVCVIEMAILRY